MKDFKKCKYGMFIHHVLPQAYYADGRKPQSLDEMADAFDTEGFADSLQRMGVEYIVYTAWHFAAAPLYPSAVSEKWRPGNCPKRDLLGDIIDSVRARGIHVILYTHPRDGHDFCEDDKEKTGWGRGKHETDDQQPNHDTFDYAKWNEYTLELYSELAERYAERLTGYYTDSNGPKDPADYLNTPNDHQVVNYLKIRNIMKSKNPELVSFQNYYGNVYTSDYGNSETYTVYLSSVLGYKNAEKWHSSKKIATTLVPFSTGWMCGASRTGESVMSADTEDIIKYTMFNGSCSECGNVLFASGTFVEGNLWPVGVEETLCKVKNALAEYKDSFMDAVPSLSYPTFPGSTPEDNNFRFWMTGGDERYEYLHCIQLPENGVFEWGLPEDGIVLSNPAVMNGEVTITGFERTDAGYRLTLAGTPDKTDTVIRFSREGTSMPRGYEWISNSDKRLVYSGDWFYTSCWVYDDKRRAEGCYERELHCAAKAGSSVCFVYEGSVLEIYGLCSETHRTADVYIDGIFCGTIDEQSEQRKAHELCFRSDNLYGGQHILQLYTKEDKMFTIDAVKVIY